jgi:hypothetical protein
MKFLPYENFYISTPLKPLEVHEQLEKEIEIPKGFNLRNIFYNSSDRYFTGHVANGSFELKRIINSRNSFLPEITGTIEPTFEGSCVHVKMNLDLVAGAFMSIWLITTFLVGTGFIISETINGIIEWTELIPVMMFLFGYLVPMGKFKFQAIEAEDKLLEILNGKIEN